MKNIVTVPQAAKIINLGTRRIRQLVREGRIKACKLEGSKFWLIKLSDLNKFNEIERRHGKPPGLNPEGVNINWHGEFIRGEAIVTRVGDWNRIDWSQSVGLAIEKLKDLSIGGFVLIKFEGANENFWNRARGATWIRGKAARIRIAIRTNKPLGLLAICKIA